VALAPSMAGIPTGFLGVERRSLVLQKRNCGGFDFTPPLTVGCPTLREIMGISFAKLDAQRQTVPGRGSRANLRSAERFIPETVFRHCMERDLWVVVVADGARFLGRFRFHSETQAEKFVGSATRQGFRAEIEDESEATAPIEWRRAA